MTHLEGIKHLDNPGMVGFHQNIPFGPHMRDLLLLDHGGFLFLCNWSTKDIMLFQGSRRSTIFTVFGLFTLLFRRLYFQI